MRKLALALAIAALLPAGAFAHNGSLGLYTDQSISDCDAPIGVFETVIIKMYYVRDQGYELGKAVEFMVQLSTGNAIFQSPWVWNPLFTVTLGSPDTGIAMSAGSCLGVGFDVVYILDISVLNFGEMGPFTVKVVPSPATENGLINITRCDPENTLTPVLGGTFIFNGTCNPAANPASWGAIKSLYR